jgi:hypothetical protein
MYLMLIDLYIKYVEELKGYKTKREPRILFLLAFRKLLIVSQPELLFDQ